jgi:hypothetical protein
VSSTPFPIAQVIERIKAQVPDLQKVEGAAEYAAITDLKDFRPPCAFAILVRERADAAQVAAGRQRALVNFGVVIVVKNYRDIRGQQTGEAAGPLIGLVRDALIGWMPDIQGARPCKWLQGDVLDYDKSTLLWSEVFETQMFIGPGR